MRLPLLVLALVAAACEPMNLPKDAILPQWGSALKPVVAIAKYSLHSDQSSLWTNPDYPDQILVSMFNPLPTNGGVNHAPFHNLLDAAAGTMIGACTPLRGALDDPKAAPREHILAGDAHWDWDGAILRMWTMARRIERCDGLNVLDEESFDIEAFPDSHAFVPGGFVTWDKSRASLVRFNVRTSAVTPFGTLPPQVAVTLRRDKRGLWAVSLDATANTLTVSEVEATTGTVRTLMTVPVGGVFKKVALLDRGVLVWQADATWWGASAPAGGTPIQLELPSPPSDPEAWHDGRGFSLTRGFGTSVNLANGRVHTAGVALPNGMHVLTERVGPDVKVTWLANTATHAPDGGALFSETLVLPLGGADEQSRFDVSIAEDGNCAVSHFGDYVPEPQAIPYETGVWKWATDRSALYLGRCAGPLKLVTQGISTEVVPVPGRGLMLVARAGITSGLENQPFFDPDLAAWVVSSTGALTPVFKNVRSWVGPSAQGWIWTLDADGYARANVADMFR